MSNVMVWFGSTMHLPPRLLPPPPLGFMQSQVLVLTAQYRDIQSNYGHKYDNCGYNGALAVLRPMIPPRGLGTSQYDFFHLSTWLQ
jgi:hypothetical protein